jgi:hypothetical protein
MGKLLTRLPRLTLAQLRPTLRSTTGGTCHRDLEVPIAPMGDSRFARCLQGGGVYVGGGTVSIVNSQIYSNTANGNQQSVRATETLPISHRPNGKLTFCSLLAGRWCLCRGWHSDHLIVHHQWEHSWLGARSSSKFPMPQWETHVLLVVCREVVSLSYLVRSRYHLPRSTGTQLLGCVLMFKSSHRPMGKLLTCLPRLTLAQLRTLR